MFDNRMTALTEQISKLTPQQRQQWAMQHRDDPILVSIAKFVNDREGALRTAMQGQQAGAQGEPPKVIDQVVASLGAGSPPAQDERTSAGIGALPAQNIGMADGGIVGFAGGGGFKYASTKAEMDQAFIFQTEYARAKQALANAKTEDEARRARTDMEALRREMARIGVKPDDGSAPAPTKVSYEPERPAPAALAAPAAAPAPVVAQAGAKPRDLPSQIPGNENAPDPTFKPVADTKFDVTSLPRKALGAGEGILNFVSRIPAAIGGTGMALVADAQAGEDVANAMTYAPRIEEGRSVAGGIDKVLDYLKVPPNIGRQGTGGPGTRRANAKAETTTQGAVMARERAAAAGSNAGPLQPAAPTTGIAASPRAEMVTSERSARLQTRAAADNVQAAGKANMLAEGAGKTARADSGIAALGAGSVLDKGEDYVPPEARPGMDGPAGAREAFRRSENQYRVDNEPRAPIPGSELDAKAAQQPQAVAGGTAKDRGTVFSNLSGEDWLTFGLGLMSNKSPRFGQAVGEAGLGALAARGAREKQQSSAEYLKALGRQANAAADAAEGGGMKVQVEAQKAADRLYDNWLSTVKDTPEWFTMTQKQREALALRKQQEFLRVAQQQFKIAGPLGGDDPAPRKISPDVIAADVRALMDK